MTTPNRNKVFSPYKPISPSRSALIIVNLANYMKQINKKNINKQLLLTKGVRNQMRRITEHDKTFNVVKKALNYLKNV